MYAWFRRNYKVIVPVAFWGTILLGVLGYYVLFPKEYWQARELAENRTKWESHKVSNYQMLVDLPFYVFRDVQRPSSAVAVVVRQGNLVSIVDAQGKALPPEDAAFITSSYSDWLTIPGLFSYALKTIWKKPPDVRVTYDPVFGYPATIYVDPYTEPCCQSFTIKVLEFQVVP